MKRFFILLFCLTNMLVFGQQEFPAKYKELWRKIDSLQYIQQPQSAWVEWDKLYAQAKTEKQYDHLLLALQYRMKYDESNKDGNFKLLDFLKQDAQTLPFPFTNMIHNLLSKFYVDYFNYGGNAWKIASRPISDENSDDFTQWDAKMFMQNIINHGQKSLLQTDKLKQISSKEYPLWLSKTDSTQQPTLYDVLARQLITTWTERGRNVLDIYNPAYFCLPNEFAHITLPRTDTLVFDYQILHLYQQLVKFHLANNQIPALIDIELNRLHFLYQKSYRTDSLYRNALWQLAEQYKNYEDCSNILYVLACNYATENSHSLINDYVKAYQLCEQIETQYLQSVAAQEYVKTMKERIEQPHIYAQTESVVPPSEAFKILVNYTNVDSIRIRIFQNDYSIQNIDLYSDDYDEYAEKVKLPEGRKLVRETIVTLPSIKDYKQHTTEVKIDALPVGKYAIAISNFAQNKNDSLLEILELSISNLIYFDRTQYKTSEFIILDRSVGKPISNAKIDIFTKGTKKAVSVYTNSEGIAQKDNLKLKNYSCNIYVSYKGDTLLSSLYIDKYNNNKNSAVKNVLFFTDRAIYRPGQTVYWKALLCQRDKKNTHKTLSKEKLTIKIQEDYRDKDILLPQSFTTNEYGTCTGSFEIPNNILDGVIRIVSEYGDKYIRVEEYKRPNFEVKLNPLKEELLFDQEVKIEGSAQAFAGFGISDATVKYSITFPNASKENPNKAQIINSETKTNEKGEFSISFIPAFFSDFKDDRAYFYVVKIEIIDLNGETHSLRKHIRIARNALYISRELPLIWNVEDKNKHTIYVKNFDDENIATKLSGTIFSLESPRDIVRSSPWYDIDMSFSNIVTYSEQDVYIDKDQPKNFAVQGMVNDFTFPTKDKHTLDLNFLKQQKTGWYKICLKAVSEKGTETFDTAYFFIINDKLPASITHLDEQWFYTTNTKEQIQIGDELKFQIAGGEAQSHVLYEIINDEKVLFRKLITVGTMHTTIRIPVLLEYGKEFSIQFIMQQNNRTYTETQTYSIADTLKKLNIELVSFRNKLNPGEKDQWLLRIKNNAGEKQQVEMVATLYDAALDKFILHEYDQLFYRRVRFNNWQKQDEYPEYGFSFNDYYVELFDYFDTEIEPLYAVNPVRLSGFTPTIMAEEQENAMHANLYDIPPPPVRSTIQFTPPVITDDAIMKSKVSYNTVSASAHIEFEEAFANYDFKFDPQNLHLGTKKNGFALSKIPVRSNFNETAFFYPQLRTDEQGEISIEFTIPEALTRWKMLGFAHTKDMQTATIENTLVTQKQVAISAYEPRFVRENDTLVFIAKINNLTDSNLQASVLLRLYDAVNGKSVDAQVNRSANIQNVAINAAQSAVVKWTWVIPVGLQAIEYKLTAQAGQHTDGESKIIPVLSNAILVTESLPFSVRGGQSKELDFKALKNNNSTTLQNQNLTLEFTSNPVWLALQALPYLMEYPYECSEQTFSRFYANAVASSIVTSSPEIKKMFDQWKNISDSAAFLSNLEKNQEFKQVLLQETPWVFEAQNESERKKRIALLFDLHKLSKNQNTILEQLQKAQLFNGAFPWFQGGSSDRYITQHIVTGFEYLKAMKILNKSQQQQIEKMIGKAYSYLDMQILNDYNKLIKEKDTLKMPLNSLQMQYLYACRLSGHLPEGDPNTDAFLYFWAQVKTSWTSMNLYNQALAALLLYKNDDKETAQMIIKSLKERAQVSDETGMYWKDNVRGYFWYQDPIETQALLIDAFNEISNDKQAIEDMKIWLMKNKQTNDWGTTKATVAAIHALIGGKNTSWLSNNSNLYITSLSGNYGIAGINMNFSEDGTGYVKTSWTNENEIVGLAKSQLIITNPNKTSIAFGAMYWQYFEQSNKVLSSEANLKLRKQLYRKNISASKEDWDAITDTTVLHIGDLIKVRIEFRADKDYDYIHIKDLRAAGFEPTEALSGYRYEKGLSYYQNIKDASMNFFITNLSKGIYTLEYDLRASHAGEFSNGITTFQCMYAPEFNAHTQGERVKVEE